MLLAIRAFLKALFNPRAARDFLQKNQTKQEKTQSPDQSHLKLLSLLQSRARFLDFMQEDIKGFSDAQVGAAVRNLHQKCQESLETYLSIRPLFEEKEGQEIVLEDYDPRFVKLLGNVEGSAPYKGILRHKGWKAQKTALPKDLLSFGEVLFPAEVEL